MSATPVKVSLSRPGICMPCACTRKRAPVTAARERAAVKPRLSGRAAQPAPRTPSIHMRRAR